MSYVAAYVSALLVFGIIDMIWLSVVGAALYKPILGDMLAPSVRIAPAVVFYLMYPIGLVVFAVMPAIRSESLLTAVGYGLLFGALAYATYDLTNFATLKNWSVSITVVDIVYGAIASGVAAVAATWAVRAFIGWYGSPAP